VRFAGAQAVWRPDARPRSCEAGSSNGLSHYEAGQRQRQINRRPRQINTAQRRSSGAALGDRKKEGLNESCPKNEGAFWEVVPVNKCLIPCPTHQARPYFVMAHPRPRRGRSPSVSGGHPEGAVE
jgi:hypothetical protein